MSLSGVYGAADDAASVALVQHALDRGITHLDSSDMYGWGHNETLLGRALRGRRAGAVLASKFGNVRNPAGGANLVNGRLGYVREACDASLARLGVDVIDLYYLNGHTVVRHKLPHPGGLPAPCLTCQGPSSATRLPSR